jgi:hypothetical protein
MADYQLTAFPGVVRTEDQASIPEDEGNRDWQTYQAWLAEGNVPDPYVAPTPPEQTPTAQEEVLFDHENRLRTMEGSPPLTMDEFKSRMAPK